MGLCKLPVLSPKDVLQAAERLLPSDKYFAMYSSVLGGVVTNPGLMSVPLEDHLVHRGDGVFDVALIVKGSIYQFEAHLKRSFESAKAISISPPFDRGTLREIIVETAVASGQRDAVVRWFISRGGGGLTVNPLESPHANFYVIVTRPPSFPEHFGKGMAAVTSPFLLQHPVSPQVKSCNYLSNVMVELSARTVGADAAVALDREGYVSEGSNKNVGFVTNDHVLMFPKFEKVLRGITATRAMEFSRQLQEDGLVTGCETRDVTLNEAFNSIEMLFFSTSLAVKPVTIFDGRIIGDGKPGPVYRKLAELFDYDMTHNRELLTIVPY
jgi:branched-chain amino acid aminotransferase